MTAPCTADLSDTQLVATFGDVMDTIERMNNTAGLADLARRASEIWAEIQRRGGEIR